MTELILAGFGGQGVMSMGQMLTYAGMIDGRQVSWIPSYGPEMRGGTANCAVVICEEAIGSPVVTQPDVVIAMNLPSMDKFAPMLKPGGLLIYNSSLIESAPQRDDITVIAVPANEIATDLGNSRVANMVIMGTLLAKTDLVKRETIAEALRKVLPSHRHDLIEVNEKAMDEGARLID